MFIIVSCMHARDLGLPAILSRMHERSVDCLFVSKRRREPTTSFGRYLRRLMDANGYDTDTDLGVAAGVSPSLISRWQVGTTPGLENLRKIAPLLKVRLVDLMIAAELATPEELGVVGPLPTPPPAKVDPRLKPAAEHLADERLPNWAKDKLAEYLREAVEFWRKRMGGIENLREPSADERAAGKRVHPLR